MKIDSLGHVFLKVRDQERAEASAWKTNPDLVAGSLPGS
jgi:hypothetical protein